MIILITGCLVTPRILYLRQVAHRPSPRPDPHSTRLPPQQGPEGICRRPVSLLWGAPEGRLLEWGDTSLSPKDTPGYASPTERYPGTCSGSRRRDSTVQALVTRLLKPALLKLWGTDSVEYYAARKKTGAHP